MFTSEHCELRYNRWKRFKRGVWTERNVLFLVRDQISERPGPKRVSSYFQNRYLCVYGLIRVLPPTINIAKQNDVSTSRKYRIERVSRTPAEKYCERDLAALSDENAFPELYAGTRWIPKGSVLFAFGLPSCSLQRIYGNEQENFSNSSRRPITNFSTPGRKTFPFPLFVWKTRLAGRRLPPPPWTADTRY